MSSKQQFVDEQGPVRRYDYPDGSSVLAMDVGRGRDAAVDVVDGTLIVVVGDEQYEFELDGAGADAEVVTNNGVVTVEVDG